MPQFQKGSGIQAGTLPTPDVSVNYDESTKQLTLTSVFNMDYPDSAIKNRLGKVPKDDAGNPTGDPRPITTKTYGQGRNIPLGFADDGGNAVLLNLQVFARTPEAEAEDADA